MWGLTGGAVILQGRCLYRISSSKVGENVAGQLVSWLFKGNSGSGLHPWDPLAAVLGW